MSPEGPTPPSVRGNAVCGAGPASLNDGKAGTDSTPRSDSGYAASQICFSPDARLCRKAAPRLSAERYCSMQEIWAFLFIGFGASIVLISVAVVLGAAMLVGAPGRSIWRPGTGPRPVSAIHCPGRLTGDRLRSVNLKSARHERSLRNCKTRAAAAGSPMISSAGNGRRSWGAHRLCGAGSAVRCAPSSLPRHHHEATESAPRKPRHRLQPCRRPHRSGIYVREQHPDTREHREGSADCKQHQPLRHWGTAR